MKPFIDKYNWEGTNYPSEKDDWKNFQKNNLTIALNVLFVKKMDICPTNLSKHSSYSLNDSKRKRMALSCSKKFICIIKRNNVKT